MAIDCYLKIDGIEGESKHEGAEGQIEVTKWDWSVDNPSSSTGTTGSGKGRATPGALVFEHAYDKASPNLAKNCVSGKHLDSAKFTVSKSGDGQKEFLTVTLKQVTVVHVVDRFVETGDMLETVNLSYGDIEFEYKTQDAKGALAGSTKFGWDLTSTKTR